MKVIFIEATIPFLIRYSFCSALLSLFKECHGDGRVALPLLVTIDKLLSHGCLDSLILDPNNTFSTLLFDHVSLEAISCTDVKRLMTMVPVVIGLMPCTNADLVRYIFSRSRVSHSILDISQMSL